MSSRKLAFSHPNAERPLDELDARTAAPDVSEAQVLVRRIAGALKVPVSVLVEPANIAEALVTAADSPPSDAASMSECLELIRAYRNIANRAERIRLLELVRRAAEEG